MEVDFEAVAKQILGAVGRPVSFQYPGTEGCKKGVLRDRAVMHSPGSTGVPYWDVVDLIQFSNEPEPEWIRIGYYRKPGDRLVYASQTTITEPIAVWKKLFVHAASEKAWFKQLLEEVMVELEDKGR